MPYRNARPTALCAACSAIAATDCLRCGAPLCDTHTPSSRRRCDACEAAYLRRETVRVRVVAVALVAVASLIGLVGAIGTHMARNGIITGEWVPAVPLLPAVAGGLFAVIFASPPLLKRIMRGRFLAERRGARGQLSGAS